MFFLVRTEGGHGGGLPAYFAGTAEILHVQYNSGAKRADGVDEATAGIGHRFGTARAVRPNRLVTSAGRGGLRRTHNLHLLHIQVRLKKDL